MEVTCHLKPGELTDDFLKAIQLLFQHQRVKVTIEVEEADETEVELTDEIQLLLNKSNSSWVYLHDRIVGETERIGKHESNSKIEYYALLETIDAVIAKFK